MTKQIRLNAFAMNCVAHQSPGLWTHPRDRTLGYNRLPYWPIGQAVVAQRAVARMGPEPRRLMRHAVHGEGVEPDLFCHDANLACTQGSLRVRPVKRRAVA